MEDYMIRIFAAIVAASFMGALTPALADNYVSVRGGASMGNSVSSKDVGLALDLDTGWVVSAAVGTSVADLGDGFGVNVELEASADGAKTRTLGIPPLFGIQGEVNNYTVGVNVLPEYEFASVPVRVSAGAGVGLNLRCADAQTQGLGALVQVEGCDLGGRWKAIAQAEYDLTPEWSMGVRGEYTDTFADDPVDVSVLGVIPVPGFDQRENWRVLAGVTRRF